MKKITTKITSKFKSKKVTTSFTGKKLTRHAGLSPVMNYINKQTLGQQLNDLFPTEIKNATKFNNAQILLTIILASLVGINRLIQIATFSFDSLVLALLGLPTGLNKDVISVRLKGLGQAGAIKLQEHLFRLTTKWLNKSRLSSVTIDADSTVKTVYGNR